MIGPKGEIHDLQVDAHEYHRAYNGDAFAFRRGVISLRIGETLTPISYRMESAFGLLLLEYMPALKLTVVCV